MNESSKKPEACAGSMQRKVRRLPLHFWIYVVGLFVTVFGFMIHMAMKDGGMFWCGMTMQIIAFVWMRYDDSV